MLKNAPYLARIGVDLTEKWLSELCRDIPYHSPSLLNVHVDLRDGNRPLELILQRVDPLLRRGEVDTQPRHITLF